VKVKLEFCLRGWGSAPQYFHHSAAYIVVYSPQCTLTTALMEWNAVHIILALGAQQALLLVTNPCWVQKIL